MAIFAAANGNSSMSLADLRQIGTFSQSCSPKNRMNFIIFNLE
jgi:hypothetical protein